jgi:hypothetical protein
MNDDYQTKAQDVVRLLCKVKRASFPLVTLFQNGVRAQDVVACAPSQRLGSVRFSDAAFKSIVKNNGRPHAAQLFSASLICAGLIWT